MLVKVGREPRPGSRFAGAYRGFREGARAFVSLPVAAHRLDDRAAALALGEPGPALRPARAFDIHLTMAQAFSVLVGLNLGSFVPSPGSLGSMETAGTAALVLCGASRAGALAFMFVYHVTQLAPGLAAGVAILVSEGELLFGRVRPSSFPGAGLAPQRAT